MLSEQDCPSGMGIRWPQPGELWSLLDMLNVNVGRFVYIGAYLDRLRMTYSRVDCAERVNGEERAFIKEGFKQLAAFCTDLGNEPLGKSLKAFAKKPPTSGELGTFVLSQITETCLSRAVLAIQPTHVQYYEQMELFGSEVWMAFPSSVPEIEDAGSCFALERYTACVFHLMRALEPPLLVLANLVDVDVKGNWNKALDQIEAALRKREHPDGPPAWEADRDFFTDAVTHFFFIKNAWRNYTMHLRLRHEEREATEVMTNVKAFMQKLAERRYWEV